MKQSTIAFANLRAEMARDGITIGEIAVSLGKTRDTVSLKLSRRSPVNLDEAIAIKNAFFPKSSVEYLFAEAFINTS